MEAARLDGSGQGWPAPSGGEDIPLMQAADAPERLDLAFDRIGLGDVGIGRRQQPGDAARLLRSGEPSPTRLGPDGNRRENRCAQHGYRLSIRADNFNSCNCGATRVHHFQVADVNCAGRPAGAGANPLAVRCSRVRSGRVVFTKPGPLLRDMLWSGTRLARLRPDGFRGRHGTGLL